MRFHDELPALMSEQTKDVLDTLRQEQKLRADQQTVEENSPPRQGQYICKHCDRPFQTQDAFLRHLKNKHGIGSPHAGGM